MKTKEMPLGIGARTALSARIRWRLLRGQGAPRCALCQAACKPLPCALNTRVARLEQGHVGTCYAEMRHANRRQAEETSNIQHPTSNAPGGGLRRVQKGPMR